MKSFWDKLPRPFFCLAPMEDVTDSVFRQIVTQVGKPDVMFTEFTHVDAILHHADAGRLQFTDIERPIVAQIWGTEPASFLKAAQIVRDLGFDGIDINMGCPVRDIVKQGGCSALIGHNSQVGEIIAATKEGAGDLPVSVKTRIGQKKIITEDWIGFLLTQDLAALTVHARTAAEKSLVPAHWGEFAKIHKKQTLLIGNGDVKSLVEAREKAAKYALDGIMIGRGIFDNVAVFAEKTLVKDEKLSLYNHHIELFKKTWGKKKDLAIMRKFAKTYIAGFDGASELRQQYMATLV